MSATVRSMKVLLVDDAPESERAARGQDHPDSIGVSISGRGDSIDVTRVARLDPVILVANEFDAVVIDLGLAGGEGFPAFRLVRSTTPDLPVFVLTCAREENVGVLAVREGAEDYLIRGAGVGPRLYQSIRYAVSRTRLEKQLKVIEAELHRAEEQLQESRRHEAAGRLAGSVAHDFNNLLTVIVGNCDFILRRLEPQNPIERDVAQIRWSAMAAGDLTRQLLAAGATLEPDRRDHDLNGMVRDAEPVLAGILGPTNEIVLELACGAGRVRADAGQIEQILMNLVLNARDAIALGPDRAGRLRIATASVDVPEPAPGERGPGQGQWVKLIVADNGAGMSRATKMRVFEPFFTTKADDSGRGLGLATVREIVAACGGVIVVDSAEGVGTTFEIHFPRVPEAVAGEADSPGMRQSQAVAETILLVEDSDAVRSVARQSLEAIGYQVVEAESGQAALALIEQASVPVDLLLTDVVMPGMGGEDLADVIRARFPSSGTLFISGFANEGSVRNRLRKKGSYLQKPFTPEALVRAVRNVLDAREAGSLASDALK